MIAILTTPAEAHAWTAAHRKAGRRVGMVPTMGALHDGHLALVRHAQELADVVVVSIFVNPLQFNRTDDFDAYPRPIDDDVTMCAAVGVDAVYAPTAATMYPHGFQTHVEPGLLADTLEGEHRPGHFRGVTTVVTKLFNACDPDLAVFGQKDFQQLAIVRRMVADLDFAVEIVGMQTVREGDGLAMSSRNRRLTDEDRAAAVCISRMLRAMAQSVSDGQIDAEQLIATGSAAINAEPRASLEYLRIVDPLTLADVTSLDHPAVAVTAVWFGEVRLIDNQMLEPPTHKR